MLDAAPFSWASTCTYVVSMPSSHASRAATIANLAAQGVRDRVRVWPGIEPSSREGVERHVRAAAARCLLPPSYVANTDFSDRWLGTVASTLAHLRLLANVSDASSFASEGGGACEWALVLAHDVALFPGFKPWVKDALMSQLPTADFVNLAVVRPWGEPIAGAPGKRVIGALSWPMWSSGRAEPSDFIKSPNLLVSGYVARIASLPVLLSSFARAAGWTRSCSVDQVLARVQYALGSVEESPRFESINVGVHESAIAHCAVGAAEADEWARHFPERHRACQKGAAHGGGVFRA